MTIQFNPNHTITAHNANHPYELEVFKDGELDTDSVREQLGGIGMIWIIRPKIPDDCSFAERIERAARAIPYDCRLYRVKVEFLNTYMDCETLRESSTRFEEPNRSYFIIERRDLSGSVPIFRFDYKLVRSISVICRFCTFCKERTEKEVLPDATHLPPVLNSMIVEYLYPKSESHLQEEIEKQKTIKKVAAATGFKQWDLEKLSIKQLLSIYIPHSKR